MPDACMSFREAPRRLGCARTLAPLGLCLLLLACGLPALAKKPEAKAAPQGEPVEIVGRVAVGLDKVFIKDQSQGFFLVQGLDLTPFAGRHIQAKGVVVRQEKDYRIVRLLEYRIQSPDDESPGAGGTVRQGGGDTSAAPARKKK